MNKHKAIQELKARFKASGKDVDKELIESIVNFTSLRITNAFENQESFTMRRLGSFKIKENRKFIFNLKQHLKEEFDFTQDEINDIIKEYLTYKCKRN